MTFRLPSLVHEESTSGFSGTGDVVLAGAVAGRFAFGARLANGETTIASIINVSAGEYEGVKVTYNSGPNSLTRDPSPIESSNGDATVNFSAGTAQVLVGLLGPTVADILDPDSQDLGLVRRTADNAYGVVSLPVPITFGGTGAFQLSGVGGVYSNLGIKAIASGTAASRPAAAAATDSFYWATDTAILSYSNGTAWTQITVGDGEITSAKLAALAVTTAKINAGAVTAAKIADDILTEGDFDSQAGPFTITSDSSWDALGEVTINDVNSRLLFFYEFNVTTAPGAGTLDFRIVETGGPTEVAVAPDSVSSTGVTRDWRSATAVEGSSATYQLQAQRSTTSGANPVVEDVTFHAVALRAI